MSTTDADKDEAAKEARERILKDIDEATEPEKMSKQKAHDFLEDIIDELESRMEALDAEIAEDEAEE